jgi:hypothetical protein
MWEIQGSGIRGQGSKNGCREGEKCVLAGTQNLDDFGQLGEMERDIAENVKVIDD